jgi:hypothetical protein
MYGRLYVARRDPGSRQAVLHLAASLREAELIDAAERLERAYDREARIVALDIPEREAITPALDNPPPGWTSSVRSC